MNDDDQFSDGEAAKRRDEVIRRMANTPPQHRRAAKPSSPGKAKTTGANHGAKKRAARQKA
ncbi:MAG TPA: hypothetical protein VN766_14005 [Stellaceae bacterium]|nr:hypothetical protein [Stellaceae bacterium]